MEKLEKKILAGVIIISIIGILWLYMIVDVGIKIADKVSENGLKHYVERIWEGEGK